MKWQFLRRLESIQVAYKRNLKNMSDARLDTLYDRLCGVVGAAAALKTQIQVEYADMTDAALVKEAARLGISPLPVRLSELPN